MKHRRGRILTPTSKEWEGSYTYNYTYRCKLPPNWVSIRSLLFSRRGYHGYKVPSKYIRVFLQLLYMSISTLIKWRQKYANIWEEGARSTHKINVYGHSLFPLSACETSTKISNCTTTFLTQPKSSHAAAIWDSLFFQLMYHNCCTWAKPWCTPSSCDTIVSIFPLRCCLLKATKAHQ